MVVVLTPPYHDIKQKSQPLPGSNSNSDARDSPWNSDLKAEPSARQEEIKTSGFRMDFSFLQDYIGYRKIIDW
jgi:hypothetical protein